MTRPLFLVRIGCAPRRRKEQASSRNCFPHLRKRVCWSGWLSLTGELWPEALSAALSVDVLWPGGAELVEWLAEILPPHAIPIAIQKGLRLNSLANNHPALFRMKEAAHNMRRLVERMPAELTPEVISTAKACLPQRTAFLVLQWLAARGNPELPPLLLTAAVESNSGWDVLSELFRAPSGLLINTALETVEQVKTPGIRSRLLTLIAPHKPELWTGAMQAIAQLDSETIQVECLQMAIASLPPAHFDKALEVAEQLRDMRLKAQILPDLAAYAPPHIIAKILFRVSEMPRMRKACALAKLAFYVPYPNVQDIFRLTPWSDSAAVNSALDRLKAYMSVLPSRLTRNILVVLLQQVYKDWISQDGRLPPELFGPVSKADPARPADSYWNFRKEDWNLSLECSVFTGKSLRKNQWFVLSFWLHVPAERTQVRELLKELNRDSLAGRTTGLHSAKGSQVSISFHPQHLQLKPDPNRPANSILKSFIWQGDSVNMDVIVRYPALDGDDLIFETASILVEDLKVGEVVIELNFQPCQGQASSVFRRVESAFASYSSQDITEVIGRLQAIEKMVPGIRLFWDVESLRSGEKWEERLAEEVVNKDVFYLFWSESAAKSKWVNWEWSCAYQKRGIDYIDPLPLDQTKPPQQLASLQFADRWVRHLQYEKLKSLAAPV